MTGSTLRFLLVLAPVFARYVDLKRALGPEFRQSDSHSAVAGSIPPRLRHHVSRPECRCISGLVPDPRACRFRRAACPDAGGSQVSASIAAEPNPAASFPIPPCFRSLIKDSSRTSSPNRKWRDCCEAASGLKRVPSSPLRPEVSGLRSCCCSRPAFGVGELLRLTLGDYNRRNATLLIRESKFHKSRLLPVNSDIAEEMDRYLRARAQRKLLCLLRHGPHLEHHKGRTGLQLAGACMSVRPLLQQCSIFTAKGRLPRIHDFRHRYAVNALLRWYREGAEVEAKLPLLATYMGHASVVSTHYYLHWVEPLRTAASERFASHYGELVVPVPARKGGSDEKATPQSAWRRQCATTSPTICRVFAERAHTPSTVTATASCCFCGFSPAHRKRPVAELDLTDLDPPGILAFLSHLERERKNGVATRNVRLSAIHALFRFVASRNPEHLDLAQRVLGIPFKRAPQRAIDYLEREEIESILKAIDREHPARDPRLCALGHDV